MKEIWKDVKGYEGLYQISNLGNLKSLKRMINKRKCDEIIKKPSILPKGYLQMALCKNGNTKYISIHRLVAETFISNPYNLPCVNHKDGNPQNNVVSNLEWITYKDNNNYRNHHLKRNISSAIFFLKRDYKEREDLINKLIEIQKEIKNL